MRGTPVALASIAVLTISLGALLLSPGARAALEARAEGAAVYDRDQDLTWATDANLAATQNFGVAIDFGGGNMRGTTVADYLAAVNAAEYLGANRWRRPSTLLPDATCTRDPEGTLPPFFDSVGYNCTGSEMGHLFYRELGGVAGIGGLANAAAPLVGLQVGAHWSDPAGGRFWAFTLDNLGSSGVQTQADNGNGGYLLLVADGDVLDQYTLQGSVININGFFVQLPNHPLTGWLSVSRDGMGGARINDGQVEYVDATLDFGAGASGGVISQEHQVWGIAPRAGSDLGETLTWDATGELGVDDEFSRILCEDLNPGDGVTEGICLVSGLPDGELVESEVITCATAIDWPSGPFTFAGDGTFSTPSFGWCAQNPLAPQTATLIGTPCRFGADPDDEDCDGMSLAEDPCPFYRQRRRLDSDENGRGDDCECGDQTGDGTVDVNDILAINAAIFNPSLVTVLCDATNDGACDVSDILAVNAAIFNPLSATCARSPVAGQ
jgi:hypothetical protein